MLESRRKSAFSGGIQDGKQKEITARKYTDAGAAGPAGWCRGWLGNRPDSVESRVVFKLFHRKIISVLPRESNSEDGAGDRDRTGDIQLGKLAFYR